MKCNLVVSINVHEKPEYLLNQIENINEYVSLRKYCSTVMSLCLSK